MATEKKYLDVDGLNVYTELIKGKIGDMQTVIDNIALDDDLKAVFGDDWNAGSNSGSSSDYLSFTAVEDSTIKLATYDGNDNGGIIAETPAVNLEYSMNGIDFQPWNYETQLRAGQTLYLRGDNPNGFNDYPIMYTFGLSTGKFNCHGNIMSLLYKDDFEGKLTIPCGGCFSLLFANLAYVLLTAPELPATTLANYCYQYMFAGCASLTAAPALHATTLADGCYNGMFEGCASLTTAPKLPATTLADWCYNYMFSKCTSLTTAPALPATELTEGCYDHMFNGCTSLTTAPELPATTLTARCYTNMFRKCSTLNYIKMLATDISADSCLSFWVNGVASTGTFVKHPKMTSLSTGIHGIPEGWKVQDAIVPGIDLK